MIRTSRHIGSLVAATSLFAAVFVGVIAGPAAASQGRTFNFSGGSQLWQVPAGVTSAHFILDGAQGGGGHPGFGGLTVGDVPVTPGEILVVNVGGAAGSQDGNTNHGGFNGGGPGGSFFDGTPNGSGGGGASDVRRNGVRLIVAGGGGGQGGKDPGGQGGDGDGGHGSGGTDVLFAGGGGSGGFKGAGGSCGTPGRRGIDACFNDATTEKGGIGGLGGRDDSKGGGGWGGGGGGGGYGGGGGGGAGSGGGGGGGGGGSFGPAGSTFGVTNRVSDGEIRITFSFDTTSAVTSSLNPSSLGQTVTFTATVTSAAPGIPDGGRVQFMDGGAPISGFIPIVNGMATLSTSSLAAGDHTITAFYDGTGDANPSTSPPITQTVNPGRSSTALVSSLNPSAFGQNVTFNVTVSPVAPAAATPTGSVDFYDGGTLLGSSGLVGGHGFLTTSGLAVGHHRVGAFYGGDANFTASDSAPVDQVVNKAPTSTALASSVNPSTFGQSVTFTATVTASSGGVPTGTVAFAADGAGIAGCGAQTLAAGKASCSVSTLTVATHPITAAYSGNGSFLASTGALAGGQTVNKAPTSTGLVANPTSAAFGRSVTFTATVAPTAPNPTAPTGTVSFFLDGQAAPVATAPVAANQASFATSGLSAGSHSVTARYNGDGNFLSSTSAPATVTITVDSTVTGAHAGSLIVPAGASMLLKNSNVSGPVIVGSGAALDIEGSTISGGVSGSGVAAFRMCGSSASGTVSISGASGFVLIGDPADDACAVNTIGGSLGLQNNHGGVEAEGNHVSGAVTAAGNSGTGAFPEDSGPDVSGNGP